MAERADWRDIYIERPEENALLSAAWQRAVAGETVVAALVAESGFGKTRFAQHFYNWLSTHVDRPEPAGYWPDHLGRDGANLRYNPAADGARTALVQPPYLWWGMRLARPNDGRNMHFGSAVSEGKRTLGASLLHYQRVDALNRIERERGKAARDLAIDLGTELAGALTFGLAGIMKTVAEFRQSAEALDAEEASLSRLDPAAMRGEDVVATIVHDLQRVCHAPPAGTTPVPIVLLVDDLQWLNQDPQLRTLLEQLIVHGVAERWPMLILFTCWEREWRGEDGLGLGTLVRSWGVQPLTIAIGKIDLDDVIAAALPGATPPQRASILEKADGNGEFLRLLLSTLLGRPSHFEDHDQSRPLSASGMAYVRDNDRQQIIADRVAQAPQEVQRLLALASKQGMRFSPELVARTGAALNLNDADRWLTRADDPYAFILLAQAQAEFRQRGIWRIATELLEDHYPDHEAVEAAYRAAVAGVAADGNSSVETDEIIALDIDSDDDKRVVAAAFAISRIVKRRMDEGEYQLAEQAAFALLDLPEPDRLISCVVQQDHFDELLLFGPRAAEWTRWKLHFVKIYGEMTFTDDHLNADLAEDHLGYVANLYNSALRSRVLATADERIMLAERSVTIAREKLRRTIGTDRAATTMRLLRVSLQRLSDSLPHGPARRALEDEQLRLLDPAGDASLAEDSVSERVNTLSRLANTHFAAGELPAAQALRAQIIALLRQQVADRPSPHNLTALAREILGELQPAGVSARSPATPPLRALAHEGLEAAERAFHLHPHTPGLAIIIGALVALMGAKSVAVDPSFRAFVRRAEEIMAVKAEALDAGRLAALDREQAAALGFALGMAYFGAKRPADERRMRELTLRLIRAQRDWWDRTSAVQNVMMCYARIWQLDLRRGRFVSAWRNYQFSRVALGRINTILVANGLPDLGVSDIVAVAQGRKSFGLTMPSDQAGEAPPF